MWINGRRFIPKGGNWGFGESMLRYRAREYDTAVRYHAEMNFNMIRNWVGQIGEDEFYDACDRHGVVVCRISAGQSLGRPRSRRRCHVSCATSRTTCCASATTPRRPLCGPQ